MMKRTIQIILLIFVPLIILAIAYFGIKWYMKRNPGLYFLKKCDQIGDDSSKFYGENWKARGFVCDGGYIPFGVKIKGKEPAKILEKMSDLNGGIVPRSKSEMKTLANKAVTELPNK